LLNQWKERIEEYLPHARIGRIQGTIIDTEDKDIVIGMIQSVCKKEYKDALFDQFGLVISDEAHRTGAKEFCKALRRSASYYTLGLTATPNRKDGLSKVFKWYLGNVLDMKDMQDMFNKYTYEVTVRAIHYESKAYEEKKLYSGGFNIANMTSQIVSEERRNTMIVAMARKMVLESKRQVLIISHRIAHIRCLEKMIKALNTLEEMVTVGLFIGGMKEDELIQTTKKNIIIGSFKMIEEGADIKTLDTLILTTPKGDVEQATGRIMRQQNANNPLILDFIDNFSIFVNQGIRRRNYYKKKGYHLENFDNPTEIPSNDKLIETMNCSNAFLEDSD
jgi:superfamily II DNA or RNA helicase